MDLNSIPGIQRNINQYLSEMKKAMENHKLNLFMHKHKINQAVKKRRLTSKEKRNLSTINAVKEICQKILARHA